MENANNFDHYLITRFNLRKDNWTKTKRNESVLSDTWLENRFELFDNYCLPSVKSQTNMNFKWLVFFDTTTPDNYKKRVEEIAVNFPQFHPVYSDGMDPYISTAQRIVAESKNSHIITTRLDNDDCISIDFIDTIQNDFDSQDYECLDYVDGYTLQIAPKIRLGEKLHYFNPFNSLVEINKDPKTVLHRRHSQWKKEKRIRRIRGKRIWLSIIHFENKVNEFSGYGNTDWDVVMSKFNIKPDKLTMLKESRVPFQKWRIESVYNFLDIRITYFFKDLKRKLGLYGNH
jgi:hypothetical protein